jgi:hypothetical protein
MRRENVTRSGGCDVRVDVHAFTLDVSDGRTVSRAAEKGIVDDNPLKHEKQGIYIRDG